MDEEMEPLLMTLTDNIAFAFKSMEDEEKREEMFKQLVENIKTIAYLVDRIRNPLAAIRGFTEIYIEDEEVRSKIFEQIERIVEIVRNLDISWSESERIAGFEL
uniref:Signal transduction histidine kinase dimerisation/phosphoacceptor domain-containing protein n=1 Tax=Archaeoglobus fulgidus TaxID=2234 RepID=A0A7C3RDT5_ARCFL